MRFAAAIAVIAVAFAAAVWIHQRRAACTGGIAEGCYYGTHRPSWEDPAAVLIAIGGVAVAVGIVARGQRFAKPS